MPSRSSGRLDVHTLAVESAVFVFPTLVMILTDIPVVERFTPAPSVVGLAVTAAGLQGVVLGRQDVHVRAGPELVLLAPLRGLSHQPDGAVDALEVGRQRDLVTLGSATLRSANYITRTG